MLYILCAASYRGPVGRLLSKELTRELKKAGMEPSEVIKCGAEKEARLRLLSREIGEDMRKEAKEEADILRGSTRKHG